MNKVFYSRKDQFKEELDNEELNRELCALAVDDMFESWSPEIQEQVLAEWNDWQNEPKKSGYVCNQCGKVFTCSYDLVEYEDEDNDKMDIRDLKIDVTSIDVGRETAVRG